MNLLPVINIIYKTPLKPEEVMNRLKAITEPENSFKWYDWRHSEFYFKGRFTSNKFNLYRIEYMPTKKYEGINITGEVEDKDGETYLKLRLSEDVIRLVLILTVMSVSFLAGAVIFIIYALKGEWIWPIFVPFAFFVTLYSFLLLGFYSEAYSVKEKFHKALLANLVDS